jgi:hypothetical protein
MANFDGLVVSLRSSRALARRTYSFLTERGRELGADEDDCVSSVARAGEDLLGTAASVVRAGAAGVPVDARSRGV